MTPGRWIGFVLVWIALVVFTVVALKQQRDGKASRALEELEVSEPN